MINDLVWLKEELRGFFNWFVKYIRRVVYAIRSAGLEDLWTNEFDLSSFYKRASILFRELAVFVEDYIRAVSKFLALFYELALIAGVSDIQEALFGEALFGDMHSSVDEGFLMYHVRSTVDLFLPPLDEYFSEAIKKLKVLVKAQRLLKSEKIRRFKEEVYLQATEWVRARWILLDAYVKASGGVLKLEDFMRVIQELRSLAGGAFARLSAISKLDASKYLVMSPELIVEEVRGLAEKMAVIFENEEKIYFALLDVLRYVMMALWGDERKEDLVSVVRGEVNVDSLVPEEVNFDKLLFAVNMARLELEQVRETLNESERILPSFSTMVELLESEELKKAYEYYVQMMHLREEYWPKIYDALLSLQGETAKIIKKNS